MANRPTPLTFALAVVIPAAIAGTFFLRGPITAVLSTPAGATPVATPAATAQPKDSIIVNRDTVRVSAKLMPVQRASLSLPTGGQVVEVVVKEGDVIKAGQPMLRLESAHQQLAVEQATLAVNQANATARQANAGYVAVLSRAAGWRRGR